MRLQEQLEHEGQWLFQWRSYLPFLMVPFIPFALLSSSEPSPTYTIICLFVSFLGFFIRCFTIGYAPRGTSDKKTGGQFAEVLNTTGIYSLVRHPLYLGNFLIFLGVLLFVKTFWFILLGVLIYWLYYERIILVEESFLIKKFGQTYVLWANHTPTFFPAFKNWKKSENPPSFKKILRFEYYSLATLITSFTVVAFLKHLFIPSHPEFHSGWIIFFLSGAIIYFLLRFLKKKTSLLDLNGES
ncbi:MAG: hypothetical protein A3D19_01200 [Deltaproteobacteria bacterium RIFCSPHIGHO2_02_FULL_38_15]|nr:MAG: hypothetical protein A3D19_01200 [Deltaproteobacteria bacterium RIFCSPHIGHO2_02_FULL_38_15]OGQ30283.1 MAG: hypothetical protein A3A72_04115 [Deltaproteobacteria bacterium RIFCSPLOWO2_01_FULL_38_9]OGQ61940.1 MAG: hypothetical protein A3G92_06630 [Deltaproteobacteria bacterium RIFCSPLOWO2_12_FULL_38_8]HBQ21883.1 hypothetical protein [Deltaproteobacteria bacterium]